MTEFALRSRRVLTPDGVKNAVVHVVGERIAGVFEPGAVPSGVPTTDLGDRVLMPGLVDSHVHVNDPGRADWEGWASATKAAASGGVTTLVDMPLNSSPVTTTAAALDAKRRAASDAGLLVDVAYWGGAIPGNHEALADLTAQGVAGAKAFMCHSGIDEFPASDELHLMRSMKALQAAGAPLLLHAELERPSQEHRRALSQLPRDDYRSWLESRPATFEEAAVERAIALTRSTGCHVHIVHLSAASALPLIRRAKDEGLPLTVETCPHYLSFEAEQIPRGATCFKCAPPIREAANREALWEGLAEGLIDYVVSDHSPCTHELKHEDSGDFEAAWGGISGLGLSLAAVWTEAYRRGFDLEDIGWWMCSGPARLAGLTDKGAIVAGRHADLVAWDPDAPWSPTPETVHFRNKISPWFDRMFVGRVESTWVRGRRVWHRGAPDGSPSGREVLRR